MLGLMKFLKKDSAHSVGDDIYPAFQISLWNKMSHPENHFCIRAERGKGEAVRRAIVALGLLDRTRRVISEGASSTSQSPGALNRTRSKGSPKPERS